MLFSVFAIATAVALLVGVRHEPAVKAWAMNPRTPGRIAHNLVGGTVAAATAVSVSGLLVVSILGAVDQAAGVL